MTDRKSERRGLGRGLTALMADIQPAHSNPQAITRSVQTLPIEQVKANPDQPRRTFTDEQLSELAQSIRDHGIIQPLIVRAHPTEQQKYQIVAGERRWRAAQLVQLHEVPVVVRQLDDTEVLQVALIENIQRENLNPIEEAGAYRQLMDGFGHTQEKLSEVLGKSRSHIANMMRLLTLPEQVLELVRNGQISAGHARALVTAENPLEVALRIVAKGLSVREAERLAKGRASTKKGASHLKPRTKDADTVALEGDLSAALGLPVLIDHQDGSDSGSVTLRYSSLDQLDEICRVLSKVPA